MPIKILIADHHPIVVVGIAYILKTLDNFEKINKDVCCAIELKNILSLDAPDIILLDISLPNFNGIEDIKEIKQNYRGSKILIFSVSYNNETALEYIKAGASGFLCKTADIATIKLALSRVSKGGIYISEALRKELNGSGEASSIDINSI